MSTASGISAEVSGGAVRLLNLLVELPLATVRDLTPLSDVSSALLYRRLGELRDHGLVDSVSLGWYSSLASRWFLTDESLFALGRLGSTWHEEVTRCRLLERLPSLEWFYQVVSEINDLGTFQSFHWLDKVSIDAVVRYQHGWVALFWSGSFQSEEWIAARMEHLAPDLRELSVSWELPWPGPAGLRDQRPVAAGAGLPGRSAPWSPGPGGGLVRPGRRPCGVYERPCQPGLGAAAHLLPLHRGAGAGSSGWRTPSGQRNGATWWAGFST